MIRGRYQFTFGENATFPLFSGFLIPHSGRIKKNVSRVDGVFIMTGSLFSFFLTKKEESTQTRLANYIYRLIRDHDHGEYRRLPSGGVTFESSWIEKSYFDNDLENYPLSEGDL